MATLFERLKDVLPSIPKTASMTEVMAAIHTALMKLIPAVEAIVGPGNGAAKKEAVLAALERFYDERVAPLNIPWVPDLLIEPWLDEQLRTLIRPLFGPAVDAIVSAFKSELPTPAA